MSYIMHYRISGWTSFSPVLLSSLSFFFSKNPPKSPNLRFSPSLDALIGSVLFSSLALSVAFCLLLAGVNLMGKLISFMFLWTYNMLIHLVYNSWGSGHAIGSFVAAGVSLVLLIIVEGWVAKEPVSDCIKISHVNLCLWSLFIQLFPRGVILNPAVVLFYLYIICLGFCCKYLCGTWLMIALLTIVSSHWHFVLWSYSLPIGIWCWFNGFRCTTCPLHGHVDCRFLEQWLSATHLSIHQSFYWSRCYH